MPVLHAEPRRAAAPAKPGHVDFQRVLRLQVPVVVRLAERKMPLSEVMRLGAGAIIEFVKSSSDPLDLLVNNKPVGRGETVKVGENFGLRVTRIGDVAKPSPGSEGIAAPQTAAPARCASRHRIPAACNRS